MSQDLLLYGPGLLGLWNADLHHTEQVSIKPILNLHVSVVVYMHRIVDMHSAVPVNQYNSQHNQTYNLF